MWGQYFSDRVSKWQLRILPVEINSKMTVGLNLHSPKLKNGCQISIMLKFAQCLAQNIRIDRFIICNATMRHQFMPSLFYIVKVISRSNYFILFYCPWYHKSVGILYWYKQIALGCEKKSTFMISCNGLLIGRRIQDVSRIVPICLYLPSHLSKYNILQNGRVWHFKP